ncbi:hypothetical protein OEZ71_13105 [Defluviimonas sp. WL0050]|uniref:Uncharacterized protein n=1 Tax=Albidovulum litorale TaxID=2984134 RepID=A0ABT2ZQ06_9RHOB|nr:hypothetical protein [Defluviimonas sp. WL0050]MCV2873234.1 hypothetical protein [Defluviimonas sp. WL0050]
MNLTAISGIAHFVVATDDAQEILHLMRCALQTPGYGEHQIAHFTIMKQPKTFTLSDGITTLTVPLSDASDLLEQMDEMKQDLGEVAV